MHLWLISLPLGDYRHRVGGLREDGDLLCHRLLQGVGDTLDPQDQNLHSIGAQPAWMGQCRAPSVAALWRPGSMMKSWDFCLFNPLSPGFAEEPASVSWNRRLGSSSLKGDTGVH